MSFTFTNGSAIVPSHTLTTNYRYNTLNQVIAQVSPDGGQSDFWYDVLGRLVVSQNAKQKNADHYSYTVYDDLGRISEVGEMTSATAMNAAISRDLQDLADWMHTKAVRDVTVTSYDIAYGESPSDPEGILAGTVLTQRNLRNRVSWSALYDNGTFGNLGLGDHASATFYTYDIHGNVDTLVQDYLGLFGETDFSRFKKIVYDYDLISGKVNQVAYQRGRPDQFYHRYAYDAENRLTGVQTSHDGWVWENEANYEYYKHGPLARTVIGQQQVQGVDYAYTVQGWLKGVNGTQVGDGTYDMGEDGKTGSTHSKVARDAYGFSLNYYSGSPWSDYHAIGATGNKFASVLAALSTNAKSLYNGNIAAMAVNIRGIGDAKLYNYKYDQLNRILEMDAYAGLQSNNTWTPVASDDYKERVSYDANGNILTYLRNGATAVNGLAMDSLTYQYAKNNAGQLINNRLRYVHDRVADNAYTEDIDSQTPLTLSQVQAEKSDALSTDNYEYDEIGNLIKDTKEGITSIEWNVYGKIRSITKGSMTITYTYDAAGNRISKEVDPASGPTRKTYYVRDATGNVMSVYEEGGLVNDGNLTQSEVHLYGSSRLGIFKPDVDMTSLVATDVYGYDRGKKFFELSNHLGNVLVSITDRKNSVAQSVDTILVDYYLPDIASANDYYPFGMTMPGRSVHSDKYRYGFNGQEKSTELDPNGNSMTAEFWQYDARLGRRWNVDPKLNTSFSAYVCFENSPIWRMDILGDTTAPAGSSTRDNPTVVGIKAHQALADYLSLQNATLMKRWRTEVVLNSGKRPDIIDNSISKTVWELKPNSWMASSSYSNYQKGKTQLKDYVAEINRGGQVGLTGSYTAGGSWGEVPIVSGTTLTSRDGTYLFTYTIANPESGMIFYSAQKVQPHPEPVVKPEPDKRTVPTGPPNVTVPLPIPLPRSSPLPRVATPTLIRAGLGRAGVWGLAAWAIYEYGKDYLNTQRRNTSNMSDDMHKAYYDALMMHN